MKPTKRQIVEWAVRTQFLSFARGAFEILNPGRKFKVNWHHMAIAHVLDQARNRTLRRLLITMQPRALKSELISVMWPAFLLGQDPTVRIMAASYGEKLSEKFARQCRDLMQSKFYRSTFPKTVLKRSSSTDLQTTMGGGRYATSIGGSVTGRGGDIQILDDPQKSDEAGSRAHSEAAWDWCQSTFFTRLDDKSTGVIIVVMQRLHEDDLAARLLEKGNWHHLNLPAIAECDEDIPIGDSKVYHRVEGTPLHPERESLDDLKRQQSEMSAHQFAAQYQQRPAAADGYIIEKGHFKTYTDLPNNREHGRVIISADFAFDEGDSHDYTAMVVAWVYRNAIYVLDVYREKVNYVGQKKALIELWRKHQARVILIEKAANGSAMRADLATSSPSGMPTPILITPIGTKTYRLEINSSRVVAGDVFLPKEAHWKDAFLHEVATFPNARYDDMVDAFSQLLGWQTREVSRIEKIAGPDVCSESGGWTSDEAVKRAEDNALSPDDGWHEPTDTGDDFGGFGLRY